MLPDRIFDHCFIGGDDKRCSRSEDEETHRLQSFDCRIRQATIQIVDQYDELINTSIFQQVIESLPETRNFIRHICSV